MDQVPEEKLIMQFFVDGDFLHVVLLCDDGSFDHRWLSRKNSKALGDIIASKGKRYRMDDDGIIVNH